MKLFFPSATVVQDKQPICGTVSRLSASDKREQNFILHCLCVRACDVFIQLVGEECHYMRLYNSHQVLYTTFNIVYL